MAPIDPASFAKPSLYPRMGLLTPRATESSTLQPHSMHSKSTDAFTSRETFKYEFDSSPVATPRRSLPPNTDRKQFATEHDESLKGDAPYSSLESVCSNDIEAGGHQKLHECRKAATVADIRMLFDKPAICRGMSANDLQYNRCSHEHGHLTTNTAPSTPLKLNDAHLGQNKSPSKSCTSRTPRDIDQQDTNGLAEIIQRTSPVKDKIGHFEILSYGGNDMLSAASAEKLPHLEKMPGGSHHESKSSNGSRARLRAFIHSTKRSGSWRRFSSHFYRRGSVQKPQTTGFRKYPTDENKMPGIAKPSHETGVFGNRLWTHSQEVTQDSSDAALYNMSHGSDGPTESHTVVRKEHRVRNWSWGRRKPSKALFVDTNSREQAQKENSDSQLPRIRGNEVVTLVANIGQTAPRVAKSQCDLQHPRPIRMEDMQQAMKLCRQRETVIRAGLSVVLKDMRF